MEFSRCSRLANSAMARTCALCFDRVASACGQYGFGRGAMRPTSFLLSEERASTVHLVYGLADNRYGGVRRLELRIEACVGERADSPIRLVTPTHAGPVRARYCGPTGAHTSKTTRRSDMTHTTVEQNGARSWLKRIGRDRG